MKTVSISEAKRTFSALVREVEESGERIRITRRGRSNAVLMPVRDWEALQAKLELLSPSEPDATGSES